MWNGSSSSVETMPMLQLLVPAFLMGAAGSLHCIGMCGPLALALPASRGGFGNRLAGLLLYNGGRALTYAAYGAVFGALGARIGWFGWQQRFSVGLGLVLLLFLMLPAWFPAGFHRQPFPRAMARLRVHLGRHLLDPRPAARLVTGLLNGLLPCGLVYMALAGAALAGSAGHGAAFMAAFGLGTLPAMAVLMLTGGFLRPALRKQLSGAYPALMALMACLLILRGLDLGIPYLSPALQVSPSTPVACP
jgi:sulfite exporter TauE/SafE